MLARGLQKNVRDSRNEETRSMEHAKTHPILIAAGVAVLLFGLLGIAANNGVLPATDSKHAEARA
jgi:hypothetical protein